MWRLGNVRPVLPDRYSMTSGVRCCIRETCHRYNLQISYTEVWPRKSNIFPGPSICVDWIRAKATICGCMVKWNRKETCMLSMRWMVCGCLAARAHPFFRPKGLGVLTRLSGCSTGTLFSAGGLMQLAGIKVPVGRPFQAVHDRCLRPDSLERPSYGETIFAPRPYFPFSDSGVGCSICGQYFSKSKCGLLAKS